MHNFHVFENGSRETRMCDTFTLKRDLVAAAAQAHALSLPLGGAAGEKMEESEVQTNCASRYLRRARTTAQI
jgi:hypothetical protein